MAKFLSLFTILYFFYLIPISKEETPINFVNDIYYVNEKVSDSPISFLIESNENLYLNFTVSGKEEGGTGTLKIFKNECSEENFLEKYNIAKDLEITTFLNSTLSQMYCFEYNFNKDHNLLLLKRKEEEKYFKIFEKDNFNIHLLDLYTIKDKVYYFAFVLYLPNFKVVAEDPSHFITFKLVSQGDKEIDALNYYALDDNIDSFKDLEKYLEKITDDAKLDKVKIEDGFFFNYYPLKEDYIHPIILLKLKVKGNKNGSIVNYRLETLVPVFASSEFDFEGHSYQSSYFYYDLRAFSDLFYQFS